LIGNIIEKDVLMSASKGVDVVFHLAAAFRELNVPDRHYYEV